MEAVVEYIHKETTLGLVDDVSSFIEEFRSPSQASIAEKASSLLPPR
jgi:methyl coenzyme M reductase beta subunit